MFCHDMWVGPDAGHSQYEDEIFEMQEKQNDFWIDLCYTDASGNPIDNAVDRNAPIGSNFFCVATTNHLLSKWNHSSYAVQLCLINYDKHLYTNFCFCLTAKW